MMRIQGNLGRVVAVHPSAAELIWLIIFAMAAIRFWRVLLPFIVALLLGVILIGLATVITFFTH
jgi:hypothetical protein